MQLCQSQGGSQRAGRHSPPSSSSPEDSPGSEESFDCGGTCTACYPCAREPLEHGSGWGGTYSKAMKGHGGRGRYTVQ